MLQPTEALTHFIPAGDYTVDVLDGGSLHATYRVCHAGTGAPAYVLQRMSRVFSPVVMTDIVAVCDFARAHGFDALPEYLPLREGGARYLEDGEGWWRAMAYLPGESYECIQSTTRAYEAAHLIGRFHRSTEGFTEPLAHTLAHFHETAWILDHLEEVAQHGAGSARDEFVTLATDIVAHARPHLAPLKALPTRLIHGDLKISNVRFAAGSDTATALLDLDTFMYASVAVELGDALRSWCNPRGEDSTDASFDTTLYEAALEGYRASGVTLTDEEWRAIPHGVALITLELAARFLTDAVEQKVFTHNTERYGSLYEQNVTRARIQLALYKDFMHN